MKINPEIVRALAESAEMLVSYVQSSSLTTEEFTEHSYDKHNGKGSFRELDAIRRMDIMAEGEKALENTTAIAVALRICIPSPQGFLAYPAQVTVTEMRPDNGDD